jgi:hypothetical protein
MAYMSNTHRLTGMNTHEKIIGGYLIIFVFVPMDSKFYRTYVQWIFIHGYLPIHISITIPN